MYFFNFFGFLKISLTYRISHSAGRKEEFQRGSDHGLQPPLRENIIELRRCWKGGCWKGMCPVTMKEGWMRDPLKSRELKRREESNVPWVKRWENRYMVVRWKQQGRWDWGGCLLWRSWPQQIRSCVSKECWCSSGEYENCCRRESRIKESKRNRRQESECGAEKKETIDKYDVWVSDSVRIRAQGLTQPHKIGL